MQSDLTTGDFQKYARFILNSVGKKVGGKTTQQNFALAHL